MEKGTEAPPPTPRPFSSPPPVSPAPAFLEPCERLLRAYPRARFLSAVRGCKSGKVWHFGTSSGETGFLASAEPGSCRSCGRVGMGGWVLKEFFPSPTVMK